MSEKVVCIIPARGGSKGVPGKNIREINGKPLIAHSILQARQAQLVDQIYVTSDDDAILNVAHQFNALTIKRPHELSTETATSESALIHALAAIEKAGTDVALVVFLQCTSPVRTSQDIDGAITRLRQQQGDSLLSVVQSHRFFWQETPQGATSVNYDYKNRPRRQDMQPQYQENGSIYVFKPQILQKFGNRLGGKIVLYEMNESSIVDIDTETDFVLAQAMLAQEAKGHS